MSEDVGTKKELTTEEYITYLIDHENTSVKILNAKTPEEKELIALLLIRNNLKTISNNIKTIKNWFVFWGILGLIGAFIYFILFSSLL